MPRILVVDDEPDILEMMCNWLTLRRYDVLAASNSAEAVHLASVGGPDLILLDASMPGVGGIETCRTLRTTEQTRRVPVILVTNSDPISSRIDAWVAGADDYVTRPVILNDLGTRIHTLLSDNGSSDAGQARLPDEVMQMVLTMLSCDLVWLLAANTESDALTNTSAATRWHPATAPSLRESFTISLAEAGRLGQVTTSRVAEFNLPLFQLSNGPRQVLKVCEDLDLAYISLVPLRNKGTLLGILLIGGRGLQDIETADGRQRLTAAVSQVTIALENAHLARLLDKARHSTPVTPSPLPVVEADGKSQYLDSLWQTLGNLQQAASLDEALQAILSQAVRMLDVKLAMILLLTDRLGDDLAVYAAAGLYARRLLDVHVPKSGIVGVVMNERVPLTVNDARNDPHFMLGFDEQWGFQVETIVTAPLIIGEEAVGVLEVINKNTGAFEPDDQDVLRGLACLASLVIEKRRLTAALAEHNMPVKVAGKPMIEPADTVEMVSKPLLAPVKIVEVANRSLFRSARTIEADDKPTLEPAKTVDAPRPKSLPQAPHQSDKASENIETTELAADTDHIPSSSELLELILDIANPDGNAVRPQPASKPKNSVPDSKIEKPVTKKDSGQIKTAPLPPLDEIVRSTRDPIILHQSVASLEYVAQSAIESVRLLAEQSGVDLVGIFDEFLPDIYMDRGRILDVIETLLEGAIGASAQNEHVKLVVRNGAKALQVKITCSATDNPLGDFTSIQRVIEQHGGHFGVDTDPQKDTSFLFTLPKIEITGMGDFLPAW